MARIRAGIGRPLDLSLPSNRFVVGATLAASAVAGWWALFAGHGLAGAVGVGVSAGGSAFLAWAVGRELDPDRTATAGVAAVAAPWMVLVGQPGLLLSGLWLLGLRLITGTTGRAPLPVDLALVLGLAVAVAARTNGLVGAMAGISMVALSAVVADPARKRVLTWMIAGTVLVAASGALWGRIEAPEALGGAAWAWVSLALVASLGGVVGPVTITSTSDRSGEPLDHRRIRLARVAAGAACAAAIAWEGSTAAHRLAPVLAAVLATAAMRVFSGGRE